MKIFMLAACCLLIMNSFGQSVNEKITLQLLQPTLLRVSVGDDLNLSESGSAILGESMFVNGGTPEFSYRWLDEQDMEYFEQTPEVFSTGKYELIVKDQNNCSGIDSLFVNDYGTGISVHNTEMNVQLRLDSQSDLLFVETPQTMGNVQLKILSLEGRILYSYSQGPTNTPFIHTVRVGSFSSGIYFIDIRSRLGISVKKIVLP